MRVMTYPRPTLKLIFVRIRGPWNQLDFNLDIIDIQKTETSTFHLYAWQIPVAAEVYMKFDLTHWGRVTHISVITLTIIVLGKGLSPDRFQTIIWTNAGILLIRPLGTNFSEILMEIHTFSFRKMHLKMPLGKCRSFCLDINVLTVSLPLVCWIVFKNIKYASTMI